MSASNDRPMDAVHALRDRGIDNPESLLEYADPEAIIRTCGYFDRQTGVGPGLLVSLIRKGGVAAEVAAGAGGTEKQRKLARLLAKFAELKKAYVPGAVAESHAQNQCRPNGADPRRWFEPDPASLCLGDLVVIEGASTEHIEVRCDVCGFETSYTAGVHSAGVLLDRPSAVGCDEPALPAPARTPSRDPRHESRRDDLRRPKLPEAKPERERLAA